MRIREGVDEAAWWEVARQCEYATFFHTPLWHQLAVSAFPHCRDVSFSAETPSGTRVVVPLLDQRRPFLRFLGRTLSTFGNCYGGPIADGPLSNQERRLLYEAADRLHGLVELTGNPFAPEETPPRNFHGVRDQTDVLKLSGTFEDILSGFSQGHRGALRKGRKHGVTTRAGTTLDDFRRYFETYLLSQERWGKAQSSKYPWALFEEGYRLSTRYPENMVLWLGESEGEIVSGAWVFYWNRHAVYWHGTSTQAGLRVSATTVILADAIAQALAQEFHFFDFNPSGGHTSVAKFKSRFGTEQLPFQRFRRVHGAGERIRRAAILLFPPQSR